jgi:hypothetical protein
MKNNITGYTASNFFLGLIFSAIKGTLAKKITKIGKNKKILILFYYL